ncbi:MAG: Abi family protein [Motiliproteus sp.]
MKFTKIPESIADQRARLQARGMLITDTAEAEHYLAHLNYYRLSGYWLPFEADHASHKFKPGTRFEAVLNSYVFDRELRLLVMDAIERIEVSLRTQWAYALSHRYGPHAHLDVSLFTANAPRWDHQRALTRLTSTVQQSRESFIVHLRNTYDELLPPIWAVVEIMTLGELSKWVGNMLRRQDRNAVARSYGLDEINLCSFLHHLAYVRNLCAHHSRLWNRDLVFRFKLPKRGDPKLLTAFNGSTPKKLYNTLAMLGGLMDTIAPGNHWKQRLQQLIATHAIDPAPMGFPSGWEQRVLWK